MRNNTISDCSLIGLPKINNRSGNITAIEQVYSHSIIRFTDANGQTYNITFHRLPVVQ